MARILGDGRCGFRHAVRRRSWGMIRRHFDPGSRHGRSVVDSVDSSLAWLIVGAVLIVVELLIGIFYLLVLGIAALVAAAIAYAGGGFLVQVGVVGVIAIAGILWIRGRRHALATPTMPSLDVNHPVTLDSWMNHDDHLARVRYRDALWNAVVEGEFRGEAGEVFYIRAVEGNTLRVAKQKA